jgi:hypothetical protein
MGTRSYAVVPKILLGYREERLTVSKQWRQRKSVFQSARHLSESLGVPKAILLLSAQLAKLAGDFIAIGTGLNYRMLRNRAVPVSIDETAEWAQVWNSVNQPAGSALLQQTNQLKS